MLVFLLIEVYMFSAFPYYGLANKITLNVDSKFHDFYFGLEARKPALRGFANIKGADLPAPSGSLISAFVIHFLGKIIYKLATSETTTF